MDRQAVRPSSEFLSDSQIVDHFTEGNSLEVVTP